MYWHIDTDIVCLILLIILMIYIHEAFSGGNRRGRYFLACVLSCIVALAADIAGSIVMEIPTPRTVYYIVLTLYFALLILPIIMWILYTGSIVYENKATSLRALTKCGVGFVAVYEAVVFTNIYTGFIFSLDANNVYSRGPLFAILYVFYAVCTVWVLVLVMRHGRSIGTAYLRLMLAGLPIIMAIGIVVQICTPGWLMILPAYTIAIFAAYLLLQNTRNQDVISELSHAAVTDGLTGLFNRVTGEKRTRLALAINYGKCCALLIVDIDDLKRINDTLGHPQGDRAICAVADTLKRHFRSTDILFRIGGDEFGVFLPNIPAPEALNNTLGALLKSLSALRIGEADDMALHCSIGASTGLGGSMTFEELYEQADTALYHVKRGGKNSFAFYTPDMEEILHP